MEESTPFESVEASDPELGRITNFQGDTGMLTVPQRRTLVNLLRRRYISADTYPADWLEILAAPNVFRTRLSDMFLTLEINTDYEVAYKQQAVSEHTSSFPTLLHDMPYNREQTIALVHLRDEYHQAINTGQHAAFVQRSDLIEAIQLYRNLDDMNQVKSSRQAENAVDHLADKVKVLLEVKDVPGRYRISPILEVLMPVSQMRILLEWLRAPSGQESAIEIEAVNEEEAL